MRKNMPKEMRQVYNRLAATYDANRGLFEMSGIFKGFFALLGKQKGHLLDLGCGAGEPIPGYFLEKGWQVTGVDFSEKMLELAKRYQPGMETTLADITNVSFQNEQFDAIISVYVLFHIEKEKHPHVFSSIYQWLKPGGKALFTYASKAYTGSETFSGYIEFMAERLFYSHLSPADLRRVLLETGFHIHGIDPLEIGGETFLWVTVSKPDEIK